MKALRLLIPVLFVALCCRVILVSGDSHQSAARAPPSISKKAIHIEGKKKKKVSSFPLRRSRMPDYCLLIAHAGSMALATLATASPRRSRG